MKSYLFTALLILLTISLVSVTPYIASNTEKLLLSMQIPANNAAVAGIQQYNFPPISKNLPLPYLSARSVLVKDLSTDTVLYQKDANIAVPIASTTKIMTAMVASEFFQPNAVLTVNQGAKIGGASVGLKEGDKLTFRSLLYGMLLNSGNDAAYAIAENYPGGIQSFVEVMNEKAKSLNLRNTHFQNPAGLDSPAHYSSAADLAKIAQEAIKDAQLARIFATKETQIVSVDQKSTYPLHNLNRLLSDVVGVIGIKTGYTDLAKENLVTLVERDGHKVLIVVLGSDDRFGDSTQLIEWVYKNYIWQ